MANALPNPNKGHQANHTRLLGDSLRHHAETNKWSENTDVNTYRGNVNNEKGFANLSAGILKGNRLKQDHIEEDKNESSGLMRALSLFATPFERMAKSLSGMNFTEKFKEFQLGMEKTVGYFKVGGERVRTGFKELTNGIGAMGPAMNALKTGIYKAVAVFNILRGTMVMFMGVLNAVTLGYFSKFTDFIKSSLGKVGKAMIAPFVNLKNNIKDGFVNKRDAAADAGTALQDAEKNVDALRKTSRGDVRDAFESDVSESTVNLSGSTISQLVAAMRGEDPAEQQHAIKLRAAEEDVGKKQKDHFKKNIAFKKSLFVYENKAARKLFRLNMKNSAKMHLKNMANAGKLFAIQLVRMA